MAFLTPNTGGRTIATLTRRNTMWSTRKMVLTEAVSAVVIPQRKTRVAALYQLAVHFDCIKFCSSTLGFEVDGSALKATTHWHFLQTEHQEAGLPCL
ncbi:hypothetical protein PC129_g18247 [Phytophthora cactorum]|uniref:Uncharacterized protein n=1 Tax=Phytophthora cactorum TaxID=29920 RepID=A0A8T1JWY9_9STRA|nr:hypothetical protein Pcac1_g21106 [Phytophthora cactorum]KAG2881419.1 hypothetical protein PC114_g21568 [Phytophthora cactorum]KAG2950197.1 hypothetical protein PC117_g4612 [Phytophthora cactorum]KAG2985466.1 hypothetical protein PC119_g20149 [Phytophthora cactorum]KAG3000968.1 hypothetical protein PC120_g20560 [Phytophthora cactorum]